MPYKPTGRRAGRPVGISNEQFSLKHRKTLLKKIATDKTIDNRTRLAAIDLYTKLAGDIQKDNLNGVVETVITFAEDPLKPATIDFKPIEKTTTTTTTQAPLIAPTPIPVEITAIPNPIEEVEQVVEEADDFKFGE